MNAANLQFLNLIAQLLASGIMVGVIWFVQVVTYPQFLDIAETEFAAYHAEYSRRISFVVIPPMFLELGTALWGVSLFWNNELRGIAIACAVVTILVWATTFLVQVPQHTRLSEGYSESTIRALVNGNWIRTILWSAHAGLAAIALVRCCR